MYRKHNNVREQMCLSCHVDWKYDCDPPPAPFTNIHTYKASEDLAMAEINCWWKMNNRVPEEMNGQIEKVRVILKWKLMKKFSLVEILSALLMRASLLVCPSLPLCVLSVYLLVCVCFPHSAGSVNVFHVESWGFTTLTHCQAFSWSRCNTTPSNGHMRTHSLTHTQSFKPVSV